MKRADAEHALQVADAAFRRAEVDDSVRELHPKREQTKREKQYAVTKAALEQAHTNLKEST